MSDFISSSRSQYLSGTLSEDMLGDDPAIILLDWIDDARRMGVLEPNAMCLATVGQDSRPSARIVLLRGCDEMGLKFFTNYRSRKGLEIQANARVAVCFWWAQTERQVRVEGLVTRLDSSESDSYFASRPLESQIAAIASPQSQLIQSRQSIEALVNEVRSRSAICRPDYWGGYCLSPERFEFWQGGEHRLHDRIVFERQTDSWRKYRLAP